MYFIFTNLRFFFNFPSTRWRIPFWSPSKCLMTSRRSGTDLQTLTFHELNWDSWGGSYHNSNWPLPHLFSNSDYFLFEAIFRKCRACGDVFENGVDNEPVKIVKFVGLNIVEPNLSFLNPPLFASSLFKYLLHVSQIKND